MPDHARSTPQLRETRADLRALCYEMLYEIDHVNQQVEDREFGQVEGRHRLVGLSDKFGRAATAYGYEL